jgi:hypothetical protein
MIVDNIGIILSITALAAGLGVLAYRSLKGKEVDRRVIFLFIFFAVALPVLFKKTVPEMASDIVRNVYDKVESLPPGSKVLISFDYDPAMAPEVQPMADMFIRHAFTKGHKVVFMSLWATGQSLLHPTIERIVNREFPDRKYGVDYATLGYKAGNEGVLNVIVSNLRKMFPTDINGTSLDALPLMADIKSCADFDCVLTVGGGNPGTKEWVLYVGDVAHVPIATGVAAVVAPAMYPYYPQQLVGILGGVKGASEYESEFKRQYKEQDAMPTPAMVTMWPQTWAHMVIIAFIIIGNISYFASRRKGKQS